MNAYVYVTYASEDRTRAEQFCQMLSRYGVRYQSACEQHETVRREELLRDGALLIALTSPAAFRAETVAVDIRRALERNRQILLVSLEDNGLDRRFYTEAEDLVSLIRFPVGETPDRHTVALFIHRLFVRHLTGRLECFSPEKCAEDLYGETISCAYRAHRGDGDACFELGRAYELGLGVPALDVEAAFWMQKSADLGVQNGRIRMGLYRLWGKGVERDAGEAFRLFSLAARDGDERGDYLCGTCFLTGNGVLRDPSFGVECLKRAAAAGYAPALYRLAMAARDGEGMPADGRAAIDGLYAACAAIMPRRRGEDMPPLSLYGRRAGRRYTAVSMRQLRRKLADQGYSFMTAGNDARVSAGGYDPALCRALGRLRVKDSRLPEDLWKTCPIASLSQKTVAKGASLSVYERGIYEDDYTPADAATAACELGKLLEQGWDEGGVSPAPARALVWYRFAVRLGCAEAAYRLGDAYRRGVGTLSCPRRAVELYRLAAELGDERGQFALAVCLERGIGAEADLSEATRLYALAADNGYAPAQNNLGGCYEHGRGVAMNQLTAVEWYTRAAASGLPESVCRLGLCYEYGRGVSADMGKAVSLYRTAAEADHPYAYYRLGLCYDHGVNEEPVPPPEAMATHLTTRYEERARDAEKEADSARREEPRDVLLPDYALTHDEEIPSAETEKDELCIPADPARAVRLYRKAAEGGIPEANYALYLCLRDGRGVPPNEALSLTHLILAAEKGHIQASCELGLLYMEGNICPQDQARAVTCFTRAVEAWRTLSEALRFASARTEAEAVPVGGMSMGSAAGTALYMLGYCTLYDLGNDSGNRPVIPESRPTPACVEKAVAFFREAADTDHVGALTMLGDLYAYGLLPPPEQASADDEALRYYLDAVRTGTGKTHPDAPRSRLHGDSPVDALMTLARRAAKAAEERMAEDDAGGAELAWVNVWHSFSEAAEYGSVDALVGMAECLFYGRGAPEKPEAAMRLLRRAEGMDGGRVVSSLWLGDCLCNQSEGLTCSDDVPRIYREGLRIPPLESECGPYTLGLRRAERKGADQRARAELLYRLATRYALTPEGESSAFVHLAEAVRMGHTAALTDLARMCEKRRSGDSTRASATNASEDSAKTRSISRVPVDMVAYYGATLPMPLPFSYEMHTTAHEPPAEVTVAVTEVMTATALYELGECYYYGYGLSVDTAAAVECYRRALEIPVTIPRGTPPPMAVTEAAYSLGYCLLYGVGVRRDEAEAVKWLTLSSARHAAACATLGLCHEQGVGVVAADDREALKYYRKALRLGQKTAARKVLLLEKRLKSAAEQS
jgi:TPR repeat protein